MTIEPFEVSYQRIGRKGKQTHNVIGVLCPTPMAQHLGLATPIFVQMGDVKVDWTAPHSEGYKTMFERFIRNQKSEIRKADMSEQRTTIELPGLQGGLSVYGKKTRQEMLDEIRRYAKRQKDEAERVLSASDDAFAVFQHRGMYHWTHIKEI